MMQQAQEDPAWMDTRICKYCKSDFEPSHHLQRYCTPYCQMKASHQRNRPARPPRKIRRPPFVNIPHSNEVLGWLEKRNYQNLVIFFRDDLQDVEQGKFPTGLSKYERQSLLIHGIMRASRSGGCSYRLTPRAVDELQKLEVKKSV